jgi:hypothetical protein
MKKTIPIFALASLLFMTSYAQDNKPEPNSFGMQYGVNFNGTIGQAVQLSGWIKHGIEIRGSLAVSFNNNQSTTETGNYIYANNNGNRPLPSLISNYNSSGSLTMTPTISVVKHFPLKSNLDFFIGGSASYGFTIPIANTISTSTTTADSFYSYKSTSSKSPLILTWGLSMVGGANFFFYKNLAIGADFGLGFGASNSNGTYQEQDIQINSGQNNSSRINYNAIFSNKISSSRYSVSFAGNAGLHLTYYIKVNKHSKTEAKI